MTKSYRVFTYSPLDISRQNITSLTSWTTTSSRPTNPPPPPPAPDAPHKSVHRTSLIYQNVIFGDDNEEDESTDQVEAEEWQEPTTQWQPTVPDTAPARPKITSIDNVGLDETYNSFFTADETSMQSEGSSISRFPMFTFNINSISSLSSISQPGKSEINTKVIVLLGILEVDGPNYLVVKQGGLAGSEVCMLKFTVGDEYGSICQLIAWRETAESWGGIGEEPRLKRGDIVLLQNIRVSSVSARTDGQQPHSAKVQLVASPNLKSSAQICYRTLSYTNEDKKWRPDLRLCDSVPAVRKVQAVVKWMELMAGIPPR